MLSKIKSLKSMYLMAQWTPVILMVLLVCLITLGMCVYIHKDTKIRKYHFQRLNKNASNDNMITFWIITIVLLLCTVGVIVNGSIVDKRYNNPTVHKLNRIEYAYHAPANIKHNQRKLKNASHDFSDFGSIHHIENKIKHEKALHNKYRHFNIKKIHKPTTRNYI